jgi:hypothetical protein
LTAQSCKLRADASIGVPINVLEEIDVERRAFARISGRWLGLLRRLA